MTRFLLDMGLRASEVAAIQLDDMNWREGTLTISHGKSRRADVLPLPVTTGKAIVQYVRGARPPSTSRALFVRHHAPFNTPITVELVRGAIRRAFGRCGLGDRYTGTHVLRHTAAVQMRCAGASLKEIADVLRHRSQPVRNSAISVFDAGCNNEFTCGNSYSTLYQIAARLPRQTG